MPTDKPVRKGSYTRKDAQRCVKAAERVRIHRAGNPTPGIDVRGVDRACDRYFLGKGFKPSISTILQTRGVVLGIKVWSSRLQQNRDRHALACLPVIASQNAREAVASEGVAHSEGEGSNAQEWALRHFVI